MDKANWRAAQYMVISAVAFTMMNATVKYLDRFGAWELLFFRAGGTYMLCMGYLLLYKINIWGHQRKLLIARGLVGTIAMGLFFLAIKELPFGAVMTLRYLSPFFAAIMAVVFLKERLRWIQCLCFILAFSGALLLRGFNTQVEGIGLVYILIAAFLSGGVYVIIRKIGPKEHPVVIINYFMFLATCLSGLLAIQFWIMPEKWEWWLLASLGLSGFIAQLYMTKALQIGLTTKVVPFKYLEVVFAVVIGATFFREVYSFLSLVGILLIILGVLLNFWIVENKSS
ncbi:MAG: Riboflavin transporter [uncultured Aureispira sp.]|uniref:Riboflavin transporter n=1 Tax=uncultured Aureispira sp. TaxID=1331704 RepID=A0A6S6TKB4_9BACT|nr:MAG: Riboflavin transporter [uncultured Aureispira sp.]